MWPVARRGAEGFAFFGPPVLAKAGGSAYVSRTFGHWAADAYAHGGVRVRLRQILQGLDQQDQSDHGGWTPAVDIYETDTEVVLVVEAAGVSVDNFKVIVDGEVVRVYGARQATCSEPGAKFHRMEIHSGAFVRSFRIKAPFLADGVRAKADDGILRVRLPKAPLCHKIIVDLA